jgi:chemotaxis protein methyltransferase CheR
MRGANPLTVASWLSLNALEATVQRDVLDLVSLSVQNLVEDSYPTGVDVIFCRNVLLYFCADTAEVVISRFHESLRPGGLLFLGYCDPRPPEGGPWSEERSGSVCYFRKGCHAEERRAPAPEVTARCASSEAQPAPTAAPQVEDPRPRLDDIMSIARGLCGQGASLEALRLLAVVHQESPFEVGPNVLAAMIAEEAGLFEEALDAARRAHFLAPDEPICQYLFGVCLDRLGETRRTELCLAQARSALDRMVDLRLPLPHGEGLTGAQLRRMIDARLNDSP